jgi:hypothetical protein
MGEQRGPAKIRIDAGPYTEDLKNFIFQNLSDDEARNIDVDQERSKVAGLASEPITIAITLVIGAKLVGETVAGTAFILTLGKLIERYMDQHADEKRLQQLIRIYPSNPELGTLLLQHLDRFDKVSIENEIDPSPKD